MLKRRDLLKTAAATLAAPSLIAAGDARTLTFVPQADLAILDPIWTTATVTRNHGLPDLRHAVRPSTRQFRTGAADGRRVHRGRRLTARRWVHDPA